MRTISTDEIIKNIKEMCMEANYKRMSFAKSSVTMAMTILPS